MVHLMSLHKDLKFADGAMIAGIETYRHAIRELRRAVEDDFVYFCSNFPFGEWGIGDTMMTAPDTGNPCFHEHHHADQRVYQTSHFRRNATTILSRHFLHRRLTLLNADTANIGTGSLQEARMRLSLAAFSGGQFFVGDRLPEYSEERLALLEKAVPIYGVAATPVDLFSQPYPGHPHIWHLSVVTSWDRWDVVCLVNLNETEPITVDLLSAFPDNGDSLVFDFWEEKPLGTLGENPTFPLGATESKILCLRAARPHPHLLATSMHVTQGAVEALRHEWTDAARSLKMEFRRRPGARGTFWIHLPPGFGAPFDIRSEGVKAETIEVSESYACISVVFEQKDATCTLGFNPNVSPGK